MKCAIGMCAGEAHEPVAITSSGNYNELLCATCAAAWRSSPDFKLAEQLVALGKNGEALSQYMNWKSTREREMKRGHAAWREGAT